MKGCKVQLGRPKYSVVKVRTSIWSLFLTLGSFPFHPTFLLFSSLSFPSLRSFRFLLSFLFFVGRMTVLTETLKKLTTTMLHGEK